jgi:macrolide transport system ATP-binding/permease protein
VSAIRRRRLALALLVARAPNLLALDEPTNHISLRWPTRWPTRCAGRVVVASHDRWLRRGWKPRGCGSTADRRGCAGRRLLS